MSIEENNNQIRSIAIKSIGSKEEVFNGLAKKTSGGLKKEDLMLNEKGKIVSIKKYNHGKAMAKNLTKVRKINSEDEKKDDVKEEIKQDQNILEEEEKKEEIKNELACNNELDNCNIDDIKQDKNLNLQQKVEKAKKVRLSKKQKEALAKNNQLAC